MREFDPQALAPFDGTEGKPAYVAHQGRVIDVSESPRWKGGTHMRRHQAGRDLTADLQAAPHGAEVLERYPQVGVLAPAQAGVEPAALGRLLRRWPALRRHPHPMTVHFPIVFALSAAAFSLLRLATGVDSFRTSAFHCLSGLTLFTPLAAATGLLTWRLNYGARTMRTVTLKKRLTAFLAAGSAGASGWQLSDPGLLSRFDAPTAAFLGLVLTLAALAAAIGALGGTLTFPMSRD